VLKGVKVEANVKPKTNLKSINVTKVKFPVKGALLPRNQGIAQDLNRRSNTICEQPGNPLSSLDNSIDLRPSKQEMN
jgi:hypothetical protein